MYLNIKQQAGSALVVAIFVIVVIFGLLLAMSRLLQSSSESVVYEVLGTRALFAAQSGLELAATELFPLSEPTANCPDNPVTYWFAGEGLHQCRAWVTCRPSGSSAEEQLELDGRSGHLFHLTSIGQCRSLADWSQPSCQSNELCTSRTVQMEVGL
ncbi:MULTISPECIES: type II secretory pathway component [Alkalimonas]|uniref:Type II secretory pathway component n=1 Tax=Alkalimonas mucilaginosa TaxID=3057676 RepID=A0ABU7JJN6_9GAMM|nr:type II secretory pathway component [Alkalimonas sp. MEB004]MEE2025916.1 type II secretory pathway component [Alkalimonas sp. MEB004]